MAFVRYAPYVKQRSAYIRPNINEQATVRAEFGNVASLLAVPTDRALVQVSERRVQAANRGLDGRH